MLVRCRTLARSLGLYRGLYRPHLNGQLGLFVRCSSESKVEETLRMLKDDLAIQQEEDARQKQLIVSSDAKKLPMRTRVMNELKHYYHGFRLLALETRLSIRYLWRLARGYTLTRRERQQLVRTVSDLLRLLPFSFFIIVPFMELALPIFLKLFPGMLPSTFQEASKEQDKIRRQLKARIEMANFLQDTLEEIALERKGKAIKGSEKESKAYEFSQFLKKARTEGGYVSNTDLFKFMKLFEDELTLDNLSMSQLRALCRILGIQPLGTPEILRFQLTLKLRDLKADDKLIAAEGGVDALSASELQSACRARGMRALGVSEERLRNQLKQWLELSLNDKVPPSLLLLTRALFLPEEINFVDRLKTILSVLPEELGEQTRQKITEMEGGKIDPKARLELLRNIEEVLIKERKQSQEAEKRMEADKVKAAKETKEQHQVDQTLLTAQEEVDKLHQTVTELTALGMKDAAAVEQAIAQEQHPTEQAVAPASTTPSTKEAKKKTVEKVDKNVLDSLEDILHGSPIKEARYDITELKEKVIEHSEDLIEVGSLGDDFAESKIAKRLRGRVNSMISGMDTLVANLEKEMNNIKEEIADPSVSEAVINKEERLVKIKDLLSSLHKLQKVTDVAKSKRIEEILHAMDVDKDGSVDANLVLEVIELLGKHKDVELNAKEMSNIIEMLKKEDVIEALDRDREEKSQLESVLPKIPAEDDEFPVRSMSSLSLPTPPTPSSCKNSSVNGPPPG